jgi:hypothetical protein
MAFWNTLRQFRKAFNHELEAVRGREQNTDEIPFLQHLDQDANLLHKL